MAAQASRRTVLGLFAVTLATLMLQILLTRIFSVTLWYHFAFMAVSIAMFGMTAGAIWVHLRPAAFPESLASTQLARYALGFAISTVVCFVLHLYVPLLTGTGSISPEIEPSDGRLLATTAYLGLTFALVAVPFVFSGVVVCVALTRFPREVGRLYAADLAGAAAGCLLLVGLLRATDGPGAVVVVAAVAAIAAWLFAGDAAARSISPPSLRGATAVAALGLGVLSAVLALRVQAGAPALRLVWIKGERETRPAYEKWSSFAYIRILDSASTQPLPFGWGFSETARGRPIPQLGVTLDATAGTVMTRFRGDVRPLDYLEYDVTNFAHHLRRDARVLVVGVGGGRDVLSALRFGQAEVTGVEINGDLLQALNGHFGAFTGHLDRDPRVRFVNDEARAFVARSDRTWDLIQISLIDTWAATAAGAFVLTENTLYTVEAWRTFLSRLAPDGLLSVSRWHRPENPAETQRLVALAAAALRQAGSPDPSRQILLVSNLPPGGPERAGVVTLVASPTPFSSEVLTRARTVAGSLHFSLLAMPGDIPDPVIARLATSADLEAVAARQPLDVSAPTDDRPFFFHMLRLEDAFGVGPRPTVTNDFNLRAVRVLGALLVITLALTALFVIGPLAARGGPVPRRALPWLAYFGAIGLGFMFVEISQIQRLIVFLGHPTYGLTVLLFALLLSTGCGSALAPRIARLEEARRASWRLAVLVAAVAVFGLLTPFACDAFRGAAIALRIAVAISLLFPLGLALGAAFPLGMSAASIVHPRLTAWFWGANGATSVCASVVAVAIALWFGISASFWTGALCYVAACAAFAAATRAPGDRSVQVRDAGDGGAPLRARE